MKTASIRLVKYAAIFLGGLFALLLVGVITLILLFPKERILAMVTEGAEKSINRKLTIGDLTWGWRGIVLEQVSFHEGPAATDPVLAQVKKVDLGIDFLALLHREIKLNGIYLDTFVINIVFDDKGISNIEQAIRSFKKDDEESSLTAKISHVVLKNAIVTLKNAPGPLRPLEGTYNINGRLEFLKDKTMRLTDSKIILPGDRGTMYPELNIVPQKEFVVTGSVGLNKTSLIWVYQWGKNVTLPYNLITGEVTNLKITKHAVEGIAKASSTLRNSPNIVFANGFTRVDIDKRTVFLSNIEGKVQTSTFRLGSLFFTWDGEIISFKVTNIDAYITDVWPLITFLPKELFGKVRGDLAMQNKRYNGNLQLLDVGYDQRNKVITGLNTEIAIRDNNFKQENMQIRFMGDPCQISVATVDSSLKRVFLNLTSENISLKFSPDRSKDEPLDLKIEFLGRMSVKQLSFSDYTISDLNFNYSLTGNTLQVKNFSTMFMEGELKGDGTVLLAGGSPQAKTAFQFDNVKVQNYVNLGEKFKNRFFGFAHGKANIGFEVSNRIFSTIDGNVEFTVSNGKLVNTGIQNGLGVLIKELKYKISDLEFQQIYGNLDIHKTTFQVNSFIFKSNDIRINIKGSFNKDLVADPLYINLEFSKYLTQDLAKAAVKMRLAKYERGEWFYVPFIIKGDFTESENLKML